MRSVHRRDFKSAGDFRYAQTKQDLQVRDLRRYGIMPVLLNDFSDYTATLKQLERRHKSRQVFVSGSAHTYHSWTVDQGQEFLTLLGARLAREAMNVITGFGLGVGSYIINGVLNELEREGTRTISERLLLRPFPYHIANQQKRAERWQNYRKDMISKAGVAIFVFGNKADDNGTVAADGMLEEFRIANAMGLLIVPVASTGSVAARIHEIVSNDPAKYFPQLRGLKAALKNLSRPGSPRDVVERTMHFIQLLAQAKGEALSN
jgi:hypothetical protein